MQGKLGCLCCTWTILVGIRSRLDVFAHRCMLQHTHTYVHTYPHIYIHTLHDPLHLQVSIQLLSRLISSHSCGCPGPQLVPCDRPRVPQSLEPGAEGVLSRFHRLCSSQRHAFELLCEPGAVVSVRPMKPCCRVRAWFVADLFCWLGLFSRRDVEASALFATKSSNCQRSFHTRSRYPQRIQVAPQSQAEKQVGFSGLSGPLWASLGSSLVTARFTKVHKVMYGMCRRLEKYIHT